MYFRKFYLFILRIEYLFPNGWGEMEGVHSRTDFDLGQHQEFSGKNLQYVDQSDGNKKYIPYVIETSVGCDRSLLAILCDSYRVENEGDKETERTERIYSKEKINHIIQKRILKKQYFTHHELNEIARIHFYITLKGKSHEHMHITFN